jgi:hypothetical protein
LEDETGGREGPYVYTVGISVGYEYFKERLDGEDDAVYYPEIEGGFGLGRFVFCEGCGSRWFTSHHVA